MITQPALRTFLQKLRKRRIIETLAAFIGGGWLLIEIVERLLVGRYGFPVETIDLTVVSVVGALLATLVWRWFRSAESRPGNVKVEVLLAPLIILATVATDLTIIFQIAGLPGRKLPIAIAAFLLGIAWVILKLTQWAAGMPEAGKKGAEPSQTIPARPEKSIVVLPFADLSPQKDHEYFCDGMTEEIITDLSHVHDLLVISRNSAMTFKGTPKKTGDIAKDLNVRYVLEGSVRKAGNDLRITVQLIDADTDVHLWADKYSGTLNDIFDIQEKVSRTVVDTLKLRLTPDEKQIMAERLIDNPLAYEYYLKARNEIMRFTEDGMNRAIQYLQNGLDIVGKNAVLYAGMGYAYYQLINLGLKTYESHFNKAEEYAKKVFELDPDSPFGHLVLGLLKIWWNDLGEGIGHLKRVLAANENDFDALNWLSWVYAMIGKKERATPLAERLLRIDPLNPSVRFFPALIQFWDGHLDRALESIQRAYQAFPADFNTRGLYGIIHIFNHRYDEAWSVLGTLAQEMPGYPIVEFLHKFRFAAEGRRSEVMQWKSQDVQRWAWRDFSLSYYFADCCSLVGENKEALDWLEHSVDLGMINYPFMDKHDPLFDNIRNEPRFKKLMERVKYEWERFEE